MKQRLARLLACTTALLVLAGCGEMAGVPKPRSDAAPPYGEGQVFGRNPDAGLVNGGSEVMDARLAAIPNIVRIAVRVPEGFSVNRVNGPRLYHDFLGEAILTGPLPFGSDRVIWFESSFYSGRHCFNVCVGACPTSIAQRGGVWLVALVRGNPEAPTVPEVFVGGQRITTVLEANGRGGANWCMELRVPSSGDGGVSVDSRSDAGPRDGGVLDAARDAAADVGPSDAVIADVGARDAAPDAMPADARPVDSGSGSDARNSQDASTRDAVAHADAGADAGAVPDGGIIGTHARLVFHIPPGMTVSSPLVYHTFPNENALTVVPPLGPDRVIWFESPFYPGRHCFNVCVRNCPSAVGQPGGVWLARMTVDGPQAPTVPEVYIGDRPVAVALVDNGVGGANWCGEFRHALVTDAGVPRDAGQDVGPRDAGIVVDAGMRDAGSGDVAVAADASPRDTGTIDARADVGVRDAGPSDARTRDATADARPADVGTQRDAAPADSGVRDAAADAARPDARILADVGSSDTGTRADAGARDTGARADSGVRSDSGTRTDAGPPRDAGALPADSGVVADTGVPRDAGAASADAGRVPVDAGTRFDSGASVDAGRDAGADVGAARDAGPVATSPLRLAITVPFPFRVDTTMRFCGSLPSGQWECTPAALGGSMGREVMFQRTDGSLMPTEFPFTRAVHIFNVCVRGCDAGGVWLANRGPAPARLLQELAPRPTAWRGTVVIPVDLVSNNQSPPNDGANWQVDTR